jgi:CBS domain containing-hemolysin-like protein
LRAQTRLSTLAQGALVVPESKDLLSLIGEMRQQRVQLAAVIDEYGGLAGIVTDEDVLEELVGEIEEGRPGVSATREAGLVPGWAREDQVREETGFAIPAGHGEYETVAGFLLSRIGHIPAAGEVLVVDAWRLEVTELDEHRIAWVRITPPPGERSEEPQP